MLSPYKKIAVFDLETGGLSCKYNSITEIAIVVIDLETLTIVDRYTSLIKPYIDLTSVETEALKEAKVLYKNIGAKDPETGVKTLKFKDHNITLKNLEPLVDEIERFYLLLESKFPDYKLTYEDILEIEAMDDYKDIMEVYFNNAYNPQALEATKIPRELFEEEGKLEPEVFKEVLAVLEKHTVGNSRPIIAGHNIGSLPRRIVKGKEKGPDGFDNPFMEKWFLNHKQYYFSLINELIFDTLKLARIRWPELASYSLGVCANELGLTLKEAHRALPDTEANAKFLIKLLESLRGEGSQNAKQRTRRKFNLNF